MYVKQFQATLLSNPLCSNKRAQIGFLAVIRFSYAHISEVS